MAKVYDALRRAEKERKQRRGGDASPAQPLDMPDPMAARSAPKADKPSFLRRLFSRGGPTALETAVELNKRRIALVEPGSYVAEQFRALRGRIDSLAAQRPIRTVAVSSPLAGEGKTTAAINLAAVTSMSVGRRVLLVDCDLRRPRIHQVLGLRPEAGLAEVLIDRVSADQAIVKVEGMNLEVLAVRGKPGNPSELLGSPKMRELIEEVSTRYDRVVLDTPAALGMPDAKTVAELCDGVVLVVRAEFTAQQDVEAALDVLDRRQLLGIVLNEARVDQEKYGYSSE